MAMRGGLSSGARERAAMAGANNLANSQQQLRAASATDAGNIRMQDEKNRLSMLENLPNMYNQMQDPAKFNIQNRQALLANQQNLRSGLAQSLVNNKANLISSWMGMQGAKYA